MILFHASLIGGDLIRANAAIVYILNSMQSPTRELPFN